MREIGRVQMGFFATPPRVTAMIAKMLTPEVKEFGIINCIDPCAGEGQALHDLRRYWTEQFPGLHCNLLGVELEKNRAQKAHELFHTGPGSGSCLFAAMDDCRVDNEDSDGEGDCSLLWMNPPYDSVRGQGRMENSLFDKVCQWPSRTSGLLVLIVPEYVLTDRDSGLAVAVERNFTVIRRMRFPDPEYDIFKQCVVIGRRRPKAMNTNMVSHPSWAMDSDKWPVMDDKGSPKEIKVYCQRGARSIVRTRIGVDVVLDFVQHSPLRGQLLMDALAEPPPIGRPPLPLTSGHLALALAGGLCDGIVPNGTNDRFMVKGSLKSCIRKTGRKEKTDKEGQVVADIDIYRTRYEMVVRCLRNDGSIEEFTSADPSEELAAALETEGGEEDVKESEAG